MDASKQTASVPPSCPGCAQRDRKIAELEARLAALEALVRGAKRQAAPFSKGVPKPNPKPPGRKSGDDYGTHQRRAVPERIDEVLEAPLPQACPFCGGGEIVETDVAQQYQTEIPRQVIHRQINVHVGTCCGCKKRVQGRHRLQTSDALGAAASQIGPDAQALAVQLNKDAGLSHGKVKRFFKAAFEMTVGRATSCRTMLRASERCEPVYQAIVKRVQRSPLIVPDETGWRIGGTLAWLHVAVGAGATAYLVHRHRGYQAAVELIGADYEGFMTHDGWSPYTHFTLATHQTCLAHLLRRATELEQAAVECGKGMAARFPRQVKSILKAALEVRDQRDAGALSSEQAAAQAVVLSSQMNQLICPTKANAANERFARHLHHQQNSLFVFLQCPGVDATNYQAEQAIRPATVNRKVWGGNRTEAGGKAQSILMSVLRTASQRGIEAVTFLSDTLKAKFGFGPQLIPETS